MLAPSALQPARPTVTAPMRPSAVAPDIGAPAAPADLGAPAAAPVEVAPPPKAPSPATSAGAALPVSPEARGPLAEPAVAQSPGEPVPVAPAPLPAPRELDRDAAVRQLETAAVKASRCGAAGSTRGNGRVSITIEPWGRVSRVTHLNQSFVGTPVGLCVMQAFQELQVPPFDGAARSIPGAFAVQ